MIRKLIRQIISESLESVVDINKLVQDLPFLKDFKAIDSKEMNNDFEVEFFHEKDGNKTVVKINKDPSGWSLDYDIIGYLRDQKADFHIGPFEEYEEFVFEANIKIKNNLVLTVSNADDHLDNANEKMVKDLVKQMLDRKEEIYNLPKGHLEDLKRLCQIIDKALQQKSMEDIMPSLYGKNKRLTGMHNILNKVQDIDFNKSMVKGGFNPNY